MSIVKHFESFHQIVILVVVVYSKYLQLGLIDDNSRKVENVIIVAIATVQSL